MYNEGKKAFTAGADVAAYRMMKLDGAGAVVYATAADTFTLGSTLIAATKGEHASLRLINYPGTAELQAEGVIALDSDVILAADGKIKQLPSDPGSYTKVGRALQAATAGAVIEVLTCAPVVVTV